MKDMSIHRRKYSKEFKMEMVEAALSGQSPLVIGKENNLAPNLISRWKKQYLDGKFHGNSQNDTELRKLKIKVCELEQMVGKLTMENYILKKEKEFIAQVKKESSSIITGPNLDQSRRHAG
jgi:transposase-like protein